MVWVNGEILVDLDYLEDSNVDIDANFVYASDGKFVEVQFTGEKNTFDTETMMKMVEIAKNSCCDIIEKQR